MEEEEEEDEKEKEEVEEVEEASLGPLHWLLRLQTLLAACFSSVAVSMAISSDLEWIFSICLLSPLPYPQTPRSFVSSAHRLGGSW